MKARSVALLVLASVSAFAVPVQDPTVYRTNFGDKYHVAGCRYLKKSKSEIRLSEAKRLGLRACKVCKPPK